MAEVLTKIIEETLASGVEPLNRRYYGIYDGYGDVPCAYLNETEVFTTESGIIKDYGRVIEGSEIGKRFSLSEIGSAHRAAEELRRNDRQIAFMTARVTRSFLSGDIAKDLEALKGSGVNGEQVCLTFTEETLTKGGAKVAEGIAEARGQGFKTAVYGFNGEQSLSALMKVPVDYAFISAEMTAVLRSRNKAGLFTAVTGLLRSLRIAAILCGIKDDDAIRDATASECFGIMPADDYKGQFNFGKGGRELKEIITDGESVL